MKKGQGMEMMGLMVIVILLIVIAGIYIKFASAPKPNLIEGATTNLQNSMLLSAIAKTTLCKETSIEDAVKNCAKNTKSCGKDSCILLEEELPIMLEAALGKEVEAKRVQFNIEFLDEKKRITIGEVECGNRAFLTANHNIYLFPGTASMTLGRCS